MVPVTIWHGGLAESYELAAAVHNNCSCASGYCAAHQAMLDQRFVDGILFARFMRQRLIEEEGVTCSSEQSVRWR